MSDSDLMFRGAVELAAMVRAGEVSSRELVETSLERIEELNPALNAFVEVDGERAVRVASEIGSGDERPFAGVPVALHVLRRRGELGARLPSPVSPIRARRTRKSRCSCAREDDSN